MRITILLISFLITLLSSVALADSHWRQFVADLRVEAVDSGVRPNVFDKVFNGMQPNRRVTHYANTQPEKRLTFLKYRKTRAGNYRIQLGRREMRKYDELLNRVENDYGVDKCFIVSLWGMESSYGRFMGSFPVLRSLATLSYNSHRKAFFRKELLIALHIVNDNHVPLYQFKGEWAGASGQPQFLPSSWKRFAVDFDGDGRRDIWKSHPDIFASIANYLKGNGWISGQPWSFIVKLPNDFPMRHEGKKIVKSVADWQEMGVRLSNGRDLPYQHLDASIIKPYGGPAFLAFNNYKVLLRYNNSIYYAGSVGYMADKICRR